MDEYDLLERYNFDYSKVKSNRFAEDWAEYNFFVSLDPDVAAVFPTSESVNEALRLLITAAQNLPQIQEPSPVK